LYIAIIISSLLSFAESSGSRQKYTHLVCLLFHHLHSLTIIKQNIHTTEGVLQMSADDINMTTCANCGKCSDNLKTCTACKMVKYCNRECQLSHRSTHKRECRKRAAEIYDEALFKEVPPEDCPICFLPLPPANLTTFQTCCGKLVCSGCLLP